MSRGYRVLQGERCSRVLGVQATSDCDYKACPREACQDTARDPGEGVYDSHTVTHILVNASQDESKLVTDRTERRVEKHSKPSQDILRTGNYALSQSSCEMDRLDTFEEDVAGCVGISIRRRSAMSTAERFRSTDDVQQPTATTGLGSVPLVRFQQNASPLLAFFSQSTSEACMGQREEDSLGFGSQRRGLLPCDCVHVEGRHDDGAIVLG